MARVRGRVSATLFEFSWRISFWTVFMMVGIRAVRRVLLLGVVHRWRWVIVLYVGVGGGGVVNW